MPPNRAHPHKPMGSTWEGGIDEVFRIRGDYGLREIEPLTGLAPELTQPEQLGARFDPFGLDSHLQTAGQRDDRSDDLRLSGDPVDERAVDLDVLQLWPAAGLGSLTRS